MRKFILPLLLACVCSSVVAQHSTKDITKAKELVFYGLDFTFLKLIHEDGFVDKNGKPMCKTLPFKYFAEWNELFLIERKKFNLTNYFVVPDYKIDMDVVTARNKAYATDGCIVSDESYRVTAEQMATAVQAYGSEGETGLGVVVFVESFNKVKARAIVHSVFFNIADHSIVKIDDQEGAPSGEGFRNYWVNAINRALESHKKDYKR